MSAPIVVVATLASAADIAAHNAAQNGAPDTEAPEDAEYDVPASPLSLQESFAPFIEDVQQQATAWLRDSFLTGNQNSVVFSLDGLPEFLDVVTDAMAIEKAETKAKYDPSAVAAGHIVNQMAILATNSTLKRIPWIVQRMRMGTSHLGALTAARQFYGENLAHKAKYGVALCSTAFKRRQTEQLNHFANVLLGLLLDELKSFEKPAFDEVQNIMTQKHIALVAPWPATTIDVIVRIVNAVRGVNQEVASEDIDPDEIVKVMWGMMAAAERWSKGSNREDDRLVLVAGARRLKNLVCQSDRTRRRQRGEDNAESQGKRKRSTDGKRKKAKTQRGSRNTREPSASASERGSDPEREPVSDPERESDTDEDDGMTNAQLADMLAVQSAASAGPSMRQHALAEISAQLAELQDARQ